MGFGARTAFVLRAIGLGALAVAVALMAGQVAVRLALSPPSPAPAGRAPEGGLSAVPDPELAWIFPPHSEGDVWSATHTTRVRTDHLGLRDPGRRRGSSRRIVVLGDSYAFGWGVAEEESFPRQLERMLHGAYADAAVEVMNAGVPGYGLYQQRAILERILADAPVDIVVSTFSLSNDCVDDLRILRFAPDRLEQYSPSFRREGTVISRIIDGSRLLSGIDRRTSPQQFKIANASPAAVRAASCCLDDLLSRCRENGARVLVVVLPQRMEVASAGPRKWVATAMAASARREVARVAGEHGVPMIDVTQALRAVQARGGAYLPNDAHWTPAGHEAVAREILEAIPREWLVDEPEGGRSEDPLAPHDDAP
jgi:lysophospholipase L1-like esterase